MSVLTVFGNNLKNLTALRGTQRSVAEELGIGRVQFQRYLRSESFPKPNLLQRICNYFGVDARILTDMLSDEQLKLLAAGKSLVLPERIGAAGMQEAMAFACPDQTYFEPNSSLPDGLYEHWRGAKSRKDMAYVSLLQIKTLGVGRIIRGYDFRGLFPPDERANISGRQREFRGLLLHIQGGFVTIYFHSDPSRAVTVAYQSPCDVHYRKAAYGVNFLARNYFPNLNRVTRSLMIRVDDNFPAAMQAGRQVGFVPWDKVPQEIIGYILPGDETF